MSGVTIDNPPAFFMEHFDSIKSEFQFLGEDKGFGHNLKHLLSDVRDTHPAYKLNSGDTAKCCGLICLDTSIGGKSTI